MENNDGRWSLNMPLRDHFHAKPGHSTMWDRVHGQWPAMMVIALNAKLPPRYVAAPQVHLGGVEIDLGALEKETATMSFDAGNGGIATATWVTPTVDIETDSPDVDEYEVRVYDESSQRLVAALEIVSPANKDRPESRDAFVAKCSAMLHKQVSVAIVDLVTTYHFNLYGELLDEIRQKDNSLTNDPPHLYASACRWVHSGKKWRFQGWNQTLEVGRPLPTIPLWLAEDFAVPLDLEATYEETCRVLRIR